MAEHRSSRRPPGSGERCCRNNPPSAAAASRRRRSSRRRRRKRLQAGRRVAAAARAAQLHRAAVVDPPFARLEWFYARFADMFLLLHPLWKGSAMAASRPRSNSSNARQGLHVRLPHVRPVHPVVDRHVLPDELPQAAAQRPVRRRARQRQLRGRARHALRLGQGLGRLAQHGQGRRHPQRAEAGRPVAARNLGLATRHRAGRGGAEAAATGGASNEHKRPIQPTKIRKAFTCRWNPCPAIRRAGGWSACCAAANSR
jgi:hypothetical protein